jgi:hypothetical protein
MASRARGAVGTGEAKLLTQKCILKATLQSYIGVRGGCEAQGMPAKPVCHKTAPMFLVFDTVL